MLLQNLVILIIFEFLQIINSIEITTTQTAIITQQHELVFNQSDKFDLVPSKPIKKKLFVTLDKPNEKLQKHIVTKDVQHSTTTDSTLEFEVNLGDDRYQKIDENFGNEKHLKYINVDIPKTKYSNSFETNGTQQQTTIYNSTKDEWIENIYRVPNLHKTKDIKTSEILKKEERQKTFGKFFDNDISDATNWNRKEHKEKIYDNIFHVMINLFDQFYWQPADIKKHVSPRCGNHVITYLSALHNNLEWAQKVYDSSGHYRGQIMYGNNLWVGQKTYCLHINQNRTEGRTFDFQFFSASVFIEISLPTEITRVLQLGECLPQSCTIHDVKTILELDPHSRMLSSLNSTIKSSQIQVTSVRRLPGTFNIFTNIKFWTFIIFIILVFLLVCFATFLELRQKDDGNLKKKLLNNVAKTEQKRLGNLNNNDRNVNGEKAFELYQINSSANIDIETKPIEKAKENEKKSLGYFEKTVLCFAFPSNSAAIFSLNRTTEDSISCVHGIRVMSLLWTIMVHTYLQVFTISENRFRRNITEKLFIYQIIGNATFSVDSFFFLSGFLVVLIFLKNHKSKNINLQEYTKNGIVNSALLFIYRYLRLTPVYLFVIIFNELSLTYVFNKTVFIPTVAHHQTCSNYWWRNILYINNFYPLKDLCMIWSWYLANDMQFYVMAIIILIISTRYFKTSVLILITFLFTSWGVSGIISLHHNYIHKVSDPFESFDFLYDKPWQRVGTYIVGMITGYVVKKFKTPPKISVKLNLTLWIFSIGILWLLIFGVWNGRLSLLTTAFYVSIGHTAWGIGLVWIVLSCSWGYSPLMNKILSYRGFLPLSRLTYCSYLIHPIIMLITTFLMEGPIHLEHAYIFTMFLGNAVLSFIVAFIISVVFEAPVIRLLKLYFRK